MAELLSLRRSERIWSLRRRESPFFLDFLCHPERSEGSRAGFLLLPAVYVGEGLAPPASFPVMSAGALVSRPCTPLNLKAERSHGGLPGGSSDGFRDGFPLPLGFANL
jgi:hypothetical protein